MGRLEKAFALLRNNYPKELAMMDKTQELTERLYRGLRQEIHQRLTPSYEDGRIPYMVLIKKARQLEDECSPEKKAVVSGARDDPQMKNVIKTLTEIKDQIQQKEDPAPNPKKKWKGMYGCYYYSEQGHWRKTYPQERKRKASSIAGGSSTSLDSQVLYC